MNDCLFCNIIAKKIPAKFVYESEKIVVIPDIHPAADIHLLIVPREHIRGIREIGLPAGKAGEDSFGKAQDKRGKLLTEVYKIAKKLVEENNLQNDSYRVVVNGGKAQHVPHLHFHLLGGVWKKFV